MLVEVKWDFGDTDLEGMSYLSALKESGLPKIVDIPKQVVGEWEKEGDFIIDEWLSDEHGFTHFGWGVKMKVDKHCKETFERAREESQTSPATTVWEFQPGNGTRYELIYTPCLRQGRSMISLMCFVAGGLCLTFNTEGFLHYTYMMEKMGVRIADAAAILEFLRLMGHKVGMPEDGSYERMEHISGPNRVYPTLTTECK